MSILGRIRRGAVVGEIWGVLAAIASSALGGTAIAATRYLAGAIDPLSLGALRFGIGFLALFPIAALQATPWPARSDWWRVVGLGLLLFGVFPALFNASLSYTTAARGALALSTLPLLTLVVAAALGFERLTRGKVLGILIAMLGVSLALLSGLAAAPAGAWRGDLLMIGAALCMALYTIWSKPVVQRSGPLTFTAMAMGMGGLALAVVSVARGGFSVTASFTPAEWSAVLYLGFVGGALTFLLWGIAVARTTPTRVAISITVNPVTAAVVGAVLLGEALRWTLGVAVGTVAVGIWIANRRAGP